MATITINPSDQTITQYNLQTGGANNLLNNVAPSSTSGVPVISQGSSSQPLFGTAVVAGGGTGQTTLTNHGVLVGAATSAITQLAAGSSGQVLQSGGSSADPAYSTATYPGTATGTGTILRANGTNWVATTNTFPNTATTGDLLYASGSNVIGNLADVATGQVLISGGVGAIPAYSATPTVTSITFGAGAALNTFTQGTFTPTVTGSSSNPTPVYVIQVGRYQRVGRNVTISIHLTYSSISGGSGNFQIASLPFTTANNSNQNNDFAIDMAGSQTTAFPGTTTMAFAFATANVTFLNMAGVTNAGARSLWSVSTSSSFDVSATGTIEV
jgi:hypothetical protein